MKSSGLAHREHMGPSCRRGSEIHIDISVPKIKGVKPIPFCYGIDTLFV